MEADFDRACELIDMLDMDSIFDSNSVEKSWSNWKRTFMSIIEDCVPKAQLPNRKNLPLLTKEIVRTIKKRNYYYRIASKHGRCEDYDRYKCLRNDVVSALRLGKANLFNTLYPNLSKNFWTAIRYVKKKQCSIPILVSNIVTLNLMKKKHKFSIITSPEILTVPYHH